MSKKDKQLTSQDLDMELMAETELARLQRQYRIMEGDRNAYAEESHIKLARQRKVISALRKEHDILLADYKVASSESNRQKDEAAAKEINSLLEEYDKWIEKIKSENADVKEINLQIRKIEKQVFKLRTKEITDFQVQIRVKSGKKSVEMLENRLQNAVKRFCVILAENKKLRHEIDHLLKERARYNELWEKQTRHLNDTKRLMLDLIEQANLAYDQREEWCTKLQALKARTERDLAEHAYEMKELQRQLDNDYRLQEFFGIKSQKRIMRDLELKEARKKELEEENMEKELQLYEDTLKKIQEIANEENIEKLAAGYLKKEEENFALFNYISELTNEVEELGNSITVLKNAIEEQLDINNERAKCHNKTLTVLRQEMDDATKEANIAKEKLKVHQEQLTNLLHGIGDIFTLVKCGDAPVLELLGEKADITDHNAMLYLGLIEKKISKITTRLYFDEKKLLQSTSKEKEPIGTSNVAK